MSTRAGLTFPAGRIRTKLREYGIKRISDKSGVSAAAAVQAVIDSVLGLSGSKCLDGNRKRVKPRHISLAVKGDGDLNTVLPNAIAYGGVVPHVHSALLPKKKKKDQAPAAAASQKSKKRASGKGKRGNTK